MTEILKTLQTIYDILKEYRLVGDLNEIQLRRLRDEMIKFINLTKDL